MVLANFPLLSLVLFICIIALIYITRMRLFSRNDMRYQVMILFEGQTWLFKQLNVIQLLVDSLLREKVFTDEDIISKWIIQRFLIVSHVFLLIIY